MKKSENMEPFNDKEKRALKLLGRAEQSLIWFNSLVTPINTILSDEELDTFIDKCKAQNILKDITGYMSLAYRPPKFIPTSATLVNFQKPGQLEMF